MNYDLIFFGLFGGFCFSLSFRVPKKYIPITSFLSLFALLGERFLNSWMHVGFATFFTSLALSIACQLIARVSKSPAQIFLIPAFIILVPGTKLYNALTSALNSDFEGCANNLMMACIITTAISFALLLANWLLSTRQEL